MWTNHSTSLNLSLSNFHWSFLPKTAFHIRYYRDPPGQRVACFFPHKACASQQWHFRDNAPILCCCLNQRDYSSDRHFNPNCGKSGLILIGTVEYICNDWLINWSIVRYCLKCLFRLFLESESQRIWGQGQPSSLTKLFWCYQELSNTVATKHTWLLKFQCKWIKIRQD